MMLAFDPGLRCSGVALFSDAVLRRAWVVRSKLGPMHPQLERIRDMSRSVVRSLTIQELQAVDTLATEWPVAYPPKRGRKRVDPNVSVLPLAGVVAALVGMLPPTVELHRYVPKEWKGTADGDAFLATIKRHLSPAEYATLDPACPPSLLNNALDAAGVGLFHLNRLRASTRLYPRGSK